MDYIFDIDGTLVDPSHRLHYVKTKPKNFPAFLAGIPLDKPILPMFALAQALDYAGHKVIYCTGREESTRKATIDQLITNGGPPGDLYMRPLKDYRPDTDVKRDLLKRIREAYTPVMVFEDRSRVVDMWRSEGLICAQVAPGDY